jgi:hypothetical protein
VNADRHPQWWDSKPPQPAPCLHPDVVCPSPFLVPSRSTNIGDINTGRCYRKTYEALVKKKDVDMLLPAIVAMDKTQVDTYGRLQMEPMTISYGLTNTAFV